MSFANGPLFFITSSFHTPVGLENVASLATDLGNQVGIYLKMPPRTEAIIFKKRIDILQESLPEDLQSLPITGIQPKDFGATLNDLAKNGGALLALVPTRRGNPIRAINNNDYERLLIEGSLPVLTLPRDGKLGPIKKVLFPADLSPRSEAAFQHTIELCKRLGAELHVLHVYGIDGLLPSEHDVAKRFATASPRELFELDQNQLKALATRASDQGVETVVATAEGRAHAQILTYLRTQQIDLAVMASHGPRSSEDILFGTTTARVILSSTIPVIGVPA
jgi:nucleotide-binding universal stress UspA family protein